MQNMCSKTVRSIAASKIIRCTVSTIPKSMSGGGRYTAYFDESLNDAEITDKWIERLDKYSFLLGEKGLDEFITYYLSDEIICNYRGR